MKTINSNQVHFLLPDSFSEQGIDFSHYRNEILDFCDQWYIERPEFTIKTSGSTGKPKLITISREQMAHSASMTQKALGLSESDNALICLNTQYIAGKMMLVRSMETGMNMYIIPPVANPLKKFDESSVKLDFTAMVPYQMKTILEETPEKVKILNKMKAILVGGAPIGHQLEEELKELKAPIYSTYGMTETVSHIALRKLNGPESSPIYTTLPGISISVDSRNCLIIKGAVTNYEEIITNDVVKLIGEDQFIWIGRVDNIINSGGIKIQIEELENKINEIFRSSRLKNRFIVTSLPDTSFGSVVALIVEGEFSDSHKTRFIENLSTVVSKYEIPKKVLRVDKFIETPSGKVDRIATNALIF